MESTAQYWRSVWLELEPHMRLYLAQAFSNRAPRGRNHDFKDAERLVRRAVAQHEGDAVARPHGEIRDGGVVLPMMPDRRTQQDHLGAANRSDGAVIQCFNRRRCRSE